MLLGRYDLMKKTLLVSMAMVVGFMRISTVNDQLHDLYWWSHMDSHMADGSCIMHYENSGVCIGILP